MCVLELFILLFILLFKCLLLTMLKCCFGQIYLCYLRPNPKFINFCLCSKSPKAERQWSIWLLSGGSHRTKCLYLLVWTSRADCVCYHMVLFSSGANGLKAEPLSLLLLLVCLLLVLNLGLTEPMRFTWTFHHLCVLAAELVFHWEV